MEQLAALASLQKLYNDQIMTPRQLFDWACKNAPSVHFGYCSSEEYEREKIAIEQRFRQSRTISGTRKLYSFVPVSTSKLQVSAHSSSDTSEKSKSL